jgi:hypothetical protein
MLALGDLHAMGRHLHQKLELARELRRRRLGEEREAEVVRQPLGSGPYVLLHLLESLSL